MVLVVNTSFLRLLASCAVSIAFVAVAALAPIARGQGPVADRPAVYAVVTGLRNDRGHIRGAIYPSRETFTHEGQGTATCISAVSGGVSRCRFDNVPAGRYAIGVMHDEDDDEHFDQGFLGIPEEGYGFSRSARGTLGPPSFDSAAFDYDGRSVMRQTMVIHYGM